MQSGNTASTLDLSTLSLQNTGATSSSEDDDDVANVPSFATVPQQPPSPVIKTKAVSVANWGIKFSGNPKDISLSAFLERVVELRDARGATDEILFKSAIDLLTVPALIYYRGNKSDFHSWKDLVNGLKAEFRAHNYDERLFAEIRSRTMRKNETIGMYLANMKSLFARLSVRIPEATQIKILMGNLLPYYQTNFSSREINTVDDILRFGRKLEATKSSIDAYVPPPNKASVLEPDLAYVHAEPHVERCHALQTNTADPSRKPLTCWNCHKTGHRSAECRQTRKRHCYRCGQPNVTIATCSKCSGNYRRTQ